MFDLICLGIILAFMFVSFIRGAIKETFGLVGIVLSIYLTLSYYDILVEFMHFKSSMVNTITSALCVYLVVILTIIIVNTGLMSLMHPIRLNSIDCFAGIFIGILKGVTIAYILYLGIGIGYYTFTPTMEEEVEKEEILPDWITQAKLYPLFNAMENSMDKIMPYNIYESIKELGEKIQTSVQEKDETKTKQKKQKEKPVSNSLF